MKLPKKNPAMKAEIEQIAQIVRYRLMTLSILFSCFRSVNARSLNSSITNPLI